MAMIVAFGEQKSDAVNTLAVGVGEQNSDDVPHLELQITSCEENESQQQNPNMTIIFSHFEPNVGVHSLLVRPAKKDRAYRTGTYTMYSESYSRPVIFVQYTNFRRSGWLAAVLRDNWRSRR